MTIQAIGYKAKAFESRNLALFFLIAFGWSWLWWGLFIFGILKMPAGNGSTTDGAQRVFRRCENMRNHASITGAGELNRYDQDIFKIILDMLPS